MFFGILPLTTIVGAFVRSRRGGTIVDVSNQGLRIRERGAGTPCSGPDHDVPRRADRGHVRPLHKGQGITVKTRTGLTAFGEGLHDAEIRYLHSIVRRTLIE